MIPEPIDGEPTPEYWERLMDSLRACPRLPPDDPDELPVDPVFNPSDPEL